MARGTLFPGEDERFELIVSAGDLEVAPGEEVVFVRELEPDALPFKPRFIVVVGAESWELCDMVIGVVPQLADYFKPGPLPAAMFDPTTTLPPLHIDTIAPGIRTYVKAKNISDGPRRFKCHLAGHEVVPRGHPAHEPLTKLTEAFLGKPKKAP